MYLCVPVPLATTPPPLTMLKRQTLTIAEMRVAMTETVKGNKESSRPTLRPVLPVHVGGSFGDRGVRVVAAGESH